MDVVFLEVVVAFLSENALKIMGFKSLGKNVKISDKASIYDCDEIEIGDNSRIDDFCVVSGRVSIGRNVHITIFCNIAGGIPGVVLEDYSTIAYGCHIFSQSDDYSGESMTNSTVPKEFKNELFSEVIIKKFAIIGARSTILPGVTIEEGCSIGAMSLVNKNTVEWSIYYGIPAIFKEFKRKKPLELVRDYESKYDSI